MRRRSRGRGRPLNTCPVAVLRSTAPQILLSLPGSRSGERREAREAREARAPRAWFRSRPRRRASAPEWRGGGLFLVPADARPGWGDLLLFMVMMMMTTTTTTTTTYSPLPPRPRFPVKQIREGGGRWGE